MEVLNTFAGLGASVYLLHELGEFNVTAVEIDSHVARVYQELYPDHEVVVGDAYEYIRNNHHKFKIIWASPPCPTHSRMRRVNHGKNPTKPFIYPDMDLYKLIIALKQFYKGNWVVENVVGYYNPLIKPYEIGRHYFWSNVKLNNSIKQHHGNIIRHYKINREEYIKLMEQYLGMPLPREKIYLVDMTGRKRDDTVFRNCVHPLVGKHVFKQLIKPEKTIMDFVS
jgi:DNA (cytosine-5)-methyltransferase 1